MKSLAPHLPVPLAWLSDIRQKMLGAKGTAETRKTQSSHSSSISIQAGNNKAAVSMSSCVNHAVQLCSTHSVTNVTCHLLLNHSCKTCRKRGS